MLARMPHTPYPTKSLATSSLEDGSLEAMADTVGGGGDTGQAGADDGNFGSAERDTGRRRAWSKEIVYKALYDLVDEEKRVEENMPEQLRDCCHWLSRCWETTADRGMKSDRK